MLMPKMSTDCIGFSLAYYVYVYTVLIDCVVSARFVSCENRESFSWDIYVCFPPPLALIFLALRGSNVIYTTLLDVPRMFVMLYE